MPEISNESLPFEAITQNPDFGILLELLEIDTTPLGGGIHRLVSSQQQGNNVFQFLGMPFAAVPYQSSGWAWDGTGNAPRPEVQIADVEGILLYEAYQMHDLVGVKVRRWLTTPELAAIGAYRGPEVWRVLKKSEADGSYIKFELGTIMDQQSAKLPGRQMLKRDFPAIGRTSGMG